MLETVEITDVIVHMKEVEPSEILLLWATALMILALKVRTYQKSISEFSMIVTLFVVAILHRLYGEVGCLFFFAVMISILVLRPAPIGYKDKWNKKRINHG